MEIYVDGSCLNNGSSFNEGGFGVIVVKDGNIVHAYQKRNINTSNNKEELRAILYAFFNFGIKVKNEGFSTATIPIVYSDSAYAVNTFNSWMFSWAQNNWIKSDGKTPENLELIRAYYDWYQKGFRIELKKIKGHCGIKYNELADKLATNKIRVENLMKE